MVSDQSPSLTVKGWNSTLRFSALEEQGLVRKSEEPHITHLQGRFLSLFRTLEESRFMVQRYRRLETFFARRPLYFIEGLEVLVQAYGLTTTRASQLFDADTRVCGT